VTVVSDMVGDLTGWLVKKGIAYLLLLPFGPFEMNKESFPFKIFFMIWVFPILTR
jgi:hypothetical protein